MFVIIGFVSALSYTLGKGILLSTCHDYVFYKKTFKRLIKYKSFIYLLITLINSSNKLFYNYMLSWKFGGILHKNIAIRQRKCIIQLQFLRLDLN